ncbi:hypothetical protein Tco_1565646, partial [Tanacetum coccineum]
MIRAKLEDLKNNFGSKPTVVVTEKDYDRDSEILGGLRLLQKDVGSVVESKWNIASSLQEDANTSVVWILVLRL